MHENTAAISADPLDNFSRSHGCRQGHIATGQSLTQTENIRYNSSLLIGEQGTCTSKTGGNFIKD